MTTGDKNDASIAQANADTEFCKRHSQALLAQVWESTVPIYIRREETPVVYGTGTLLRIAERSFLVSASHVLWKAQQEGLPYLPSKTEGMFNVVGKPIRFRSGPSYVKDENDIAIIELDAEEVKSLDGYRFVRLLDTETEGRHGDDLYLVAGFPKSLSSNNRPNPTVISATKYSFFARPYKLDTTSFPGFDRTRHILIDATRNEAIALEGTQPVPFLLDGMSGCSIWKTNCATKGDAWQPADVVIVGVQTMAYTSPNRAVRGTVWAAVAKLIYERFTELRPALDLLVPKR